MSVIVEMSAWYVIPALMGTIGLVIAFFVAVLGDKWKIGAVIAVVSLAILYGSSQVDKRVDAPRNQARVAAAIEQLQPYHGQLSETRFPLKELVQKDLLHGEIKGSVGGSFFLIIGGISGSVYGQVDEAQRLTLVYFDDDTLIDGDRGVWRVKTFLLEDAKIVTIPVSEGPYLKYASEIQVFDNRVALVAAGVPTLYLPEGWQLIGASERY